MTVQPPKPELISQNKAFGGIAYRYKHASTSTQCPMIFTLYLPPQAQAGHKVPAVYWLSGLTCTDENFTQKAGAFAKAAQLGIAIIAPDTSPRGDDIPDDPDKAYDFGLGAGFYINATQSPWDKNYHMYDYVVQELPELIEAHFPVSDKRAISGHSMGGHGALVIALKNPTRYSSVTAFSPISNPIDCPWGQKAFSNYLGQDKKTWEAYDTSLLMAQAQEKVPALVDQGLADNFLVEQLKPEALFEASKKSDYPLTLRLQDGYDHSYFFISTFINDHLEYHARHFKA